MEFTWILLSVLIGFVCFYLGRLFAELSFKKKEKRIREDAITRSRAVLGGQFSEQLAPFLPDFPYSPTEVKFLGKPTDFIVFQGLDEKKVTRVVFVEVKSGTSRLSASEKSLKEAVEKKQVDFEVYHVPSDVTFRKK